MVESMAKTTRPSSVAAIVSDVHFLGDRAPHASWKAFRKWHADVEPSVVVVGGDLLDFGHLSPYEDTAMGQGGAIAQIKQGVRELNELSKISRVLLQMGNHEERWEKLLLGGRIAKFNEAVGLTLADQFRAQGLSSDVMMAQEELFIGARDGRVLIRHGHKQGSRYGAKHLAANQLAACPHVNSVHGHHHRADFFVHTSQSTTRWGISNPCLSPGFGYSNGGDNNWQRGFTVLEFFGNDEYVTPSILMMSDADSFAWRGRVYDGRAK